jgi:hypothetical protein
MATRGRDKMPDSNMAIKPSPREAGHPGPEQQDKIKVAFKEGSNNITEPGPATARGFLARSLEIG